MIGTSEATFECPNCSICVHCGRQIFWSDWCYAHRNGWADCGRYVNDQIEHGSHHARQMSPVQLAELCQVVCGLFL